MKARFLMIPMLLVAASCQQELETPDPIAKPEQGSETTGTYTLTIQASKGTETRALDLDGNTLTPYWKNNDVVNVYKNGSFLGTITVQCTGEKPTTATLTGTMTGTMPAKDDVLTLLIPRETWDYTQQTGALTGEGSIEDTFDYATATVTVDAIDEDSVTTTAADFRNEQSIYRFSFKNGSNALSVKDFTVSAVGGNLVQSRTLSGSDWTSVKGALVVKPVAATTDPLYISLRNETTTADDTYSFVVTSDNNALYMATKTIPAAALATPGKFVSGTITVTQPDFSPSSGEISNEDLVL